METIIWTRRGSQTSEWLNAQVSISTADVDRVRPPDVFFKSQSTFIHIYQQINRYSMTITLYR